MSGWETDPWVTGSLAVTLTLYVAGVASLWRRAGFGRGVAPWQAVCFILAWWTLVAALVSPLHEWSEHLFAAHMIEHELLMAVAAPLLCVSQPNGALLRGLPRVLRQAIVSGSGSAPVRVVWRFLMIPLVATLLHAIAIWTWHIPRLLDGALEHEWMHRLQHISFLGTALIFWWAIIRRPQREYGAGAMHIFATMMHMGLLGALLTLSPHVWYPLQTVGAPAYGLTPLEDQQFAGLIMWVPAGTLYMAAGLVAFGLWLGSGNRNNKSSQSIPAWSGGPQ